MVTVLYVENCDNRFKSFKSKKSARKFVESLVEADVYTQNNTRYLTGIVIGEYKQAKLDYIEKKILKKLKE